jgi:quercetin dioxygenase-like cupin family protein
MSAAPRQPRVGDTYIMVNDAYTFRATGKETGGAYMIIDTEIPPGGGPPPHIHTRETEVFVVLQGRVTCTENGQSRTLGPGESITLLPNRPHSFRNNTDKPARMLVICLPAGIEQMFADAGEPVLGGSELKPARPPTPGEMQRLVECCTRAGISLVS